MRKLIVFIISAMILSCETPVTPDNGISPIRILNKSSYYVRTVYITESSSTDKGRNRLPTGEIIRPEGSRSFDVEDGIWDIYVETGPDMDYTYHAWDFTSKVIDGNGITCIIGD